MERVQTGEVNSYAAHKQYGIPRSTFENHLRGKANGLKLDVRRFLAKNKKN